MIFYEEKIIREKIKMINQKTIMFTLIIQICILQIIPHTIKKMKTFEILLNDMDYDEQNENEMIRPADLRDLKPLAEDEDRYKLLHSHVKYYNEQNSENKTQLYNIFPYLQPRMEEIFNSEQEDKPFIAGFKHELDKETTTTHEILIKIKDAKADQIRTNFNKTNVRKMKRLQNYRNDESTKISRIKREEEEYHYRTTLEEMDFFQVIRNKNMTTNKTTEITEYIMKPQMIRVQHDTMYEYDENITIDDTTNDILRNQFLISKEDYTPDTESPDEEPYDYEKFKIEYEQQFEYNIRYGKVFNYTAKEEDSPKEALKKIMDLKEPENCTKEELNQIGIKAMKCLIYDYQRTKNIAIMKKILWRIWLVVRIWLLIYVCLAIPCWLQRGWCCCCFRCKFCFPRKRILFAKQYYMLNPPGTFVKSLKPKDVENPILYEATEHERNAYNAFEIAIKKI